MSIRSCPYQRKPTPEVQANIQAVQHARLFVVQEKGPTSFVLSDPAKQKYTVRIGERNECSCLSPHVCVHILFVMLKLYRIPAENPIVWQKSLIDDEVSKIVSGRMLILDERKRVRRALRAQRPWRTHLTGLGDADDDVPPPEPEIPEVPRKEADADDECPICLEAVLGQALVYCRYGCGKPLHAECIVHYSHHAVEIGQTLKCPLCRTDWGKVEVAEPPPKQPVDLHVGVRCDHCRNAVAGSRYKCTICEEYDLCAACYFMLPHRPHAFHPFVYRAAPSAPWEAPPEQPPPSLVIHEPPVAPTVPSSLLAGNRASAHLVADLSTRDISPEDYDLLLQLDLRAHHPPGHHRSRSRRDTSLDDATPEHRTRRRRQRAHPDEVRHRSPSEPEPLALQINGVPPPRPAPLLEASASLGALSLESTSTSSAASAYSLPPSPLRRRSASLTTSGGLAASAPSQLQAIGASSQHFSPASNAGHQPNQWVRGTHELPTGHSAAAASGHVVMGLTTRFRRRVSVDIVHDAAESLGVGALPLMNNSHSEGSLGRAASGSTGPRREARLPRLIAGRPPPQLAAAAARHNASLSRTHQQQTLGQTSPLGPIELTGLRVALPASGPPAAIAAVPVSAVAVAGVTS